MAINSVAKNKLRTLKFSAIVIASVVIVEVILGLAVNSLAILSDGLHALLDVITSIMLFVATREALKPPDEEHTYGHEKFESIGGLIGGVILIGVGILVIYEAASKLIQGDVVNIAFGLAGFFAIGYTFLIDIFRMFMFRKASGSESTTVKAGFYHALADLISTGIAFFGFGLASVGIYQSDSLASIVLGILLSYMSFKLVKGSIMELSDTASKDLVKKTKMSLLNNDGVRNCRTLKVRKVGSKIFIECTIEVSDLMSLKEAHTLASNIEENLARTFGTIDATIHIEPSEERKEVEQFIETLATVENVKEVHDILTVYVSGKLHITLHASVDPNLSVEEAHTIAEMIENNIQAEIKQLESVTVHIEPYSLRKSSIEIDEKELKTIIDKISKSVKMKLRLKRTMTYEFDRKRYINVDCCFTKDIPLSKAHEIASQVEKEITEYFSDIVVMVHIEPECK